MKKPINHDMVRVEEVLEIIRTYRQGTTPSARAVLSDIESKILKLDSRKRLTIIDGGKK